MNTPNQHLTIEQVKQQFNDWRSHRGKLGSFPDELWINAVNLLEHYDSLSIIHELGITRKQLNDRTMRHSKITDCNNFVELDVANNINEQCVVATKYTNDTIPQISLEPSSSIELRKPNGTMLVIHDLSRSDVQALVATFME